MERLTRTDWKTMNPMECCGQKDYCIRRREVENACLNCIVPKLYVRVAAYEDTGLTTEGVEYALRYLNSTSMAEIKDFEGVPVNRLKELAEADKDGRLVMLPCKVYETDGARVYEHTVREVIYETADGPAFDKNAIGKSIFLTRAEAERALQEMEGRKDG